MTPAALDQIQATLAQAGDAQIARVVAMVDAMPNRGDADSLIAPLRPRLASLRPERPRSLDRVLFMPLAPVIVPLAGWRVDGVGVPRPALAPLKATIRGALAHRGFWQRYREGATEVAAELWRSAAGVLDPLDMPPSWPDATGLTIRHYQVIVSTVIAVLQDASTIELLAARKRPAEDDALRPILSRSKEHGPAALDTVAAILLARLPDPARTLTLAAQVSGGDRATRQALDRVGSELSARQDGTHDPAAAEREVTRIASLVTGLEAQASPALRVQLEAVRRAAGGFCQRSFSQAVDQAMSLAGITTVDDAAMGEIEAISRTLRRLEAAGRTLGGGEAYETTLSAAVTAIRCSSGGMTLADKVRAVEILAGPEAALSLLDAAVADTCSSPP